MQDELKPCPFCGADESRLCQATMHADDLTIYSVECLDCGAEIADDESQDAADRHWNTRVVAHPPTTIPVDDRETTVGDHQMVEAVARAIYEEDDPWHKAWPWPDLQPSQANPDAYRRLAQASLTAARAQVDAENQRLREALGITAQALLEVEGAQKRGSTWYTNGASGLYQQVAMWVTRGKVAARQALAAGEHRKDAP